MKCNTFILDSKQEEFFSRMGAESLFNNVSRKDFLTHTEQNTHDKSWVILECEEIKDEYAKLPKKDLEYLLECHIIQDLEHAFWGHHFKVLVQCSNYNKDGFYSFQVYVETLREIFYG